MDESLTMTLVPVFARLREIAMERGISSASIGRELGVTKAHMARWARGGREPSLAVVRWLAGRLGYALLVLPDRVALVPIEAAKVLVEYDS